MTLRFEERAVYGRIRLYPSNSEARAIVDLTGRKCLNPDEIAHLRLHGFLIEVSEAENVQKAEKSSDRIAKQVLAYDETMERIETMIRNTKRGKS